MPQSLSLVLLHVIFSTKDRVPFLKPALRPKLHAYLATVTRNLDCDCLLVGGIDDHVHLAIGLSRTITLAKLVEQVKTSSSKFLKTDVPNFAWQRGYGVFSVNPFDLPALKQYIATQEQHQQKTNLPGRTPRSPANKQHPLRRTIPLGLVHHSKGQRSGGWPYNWVPHLRRVL